MLTRPPFTRFRDEPLRLNFGANYPRTRSSIDITGGLHALGDLADQAVADVVSRTQQRPHLAGPYFPGRDDLSADLGHDDEPEPTAENFPRQPRTRLLPPDPARLPDWLAMTLSLMASLGITGVVLLLAGFVVSLGWHVAMLLILALAGTPLATS